MKKAVDSSSLAEAIDRILCEGIVIDAYVRNFTVLKHLTMTSSLP